MYASKTRSNWLKALPIGSLLLWTCLWVNLNSDLGNIRQPHSLNDWQLLIRAILPFLVIALALLILSGRRSIRIPMSSPSSLLLIYGVIALIASVFSPQPTWALYWSAPFLATILAAWTFANGRDPVLSGRQLLLVTWTATFIVAAILCYQTSNVVFSSAPTAYGVIDEVNGLSRTSGVARWAAVPGLVCIIRAFHTRRITFIAFYLSVAAVAFYIVYRMQSRGAVLGSVAALLFVMLVSSRMRRYALPFAAVALVAIVLMETSDVVSTRVADYLKRGQSEEEFMSMTGRTRAYQHGIEAFTDAPIFGRGQWADRLTIGEHVHNSFLQAMLNGGILGSIPYFASWAAGWMLFYKLYKRRAKLATNDRVCLLEAGAVMMFFTLRAIPETTTASFSVDLLVMVAVYVYMETLAISSLRRPVRAKAPIYLRTHGVQRPVRLPYVR